MGNPLFNLMGNSKHGNMANLVNQFYQFKNSFRGDPQQEVQKLLNSGKITQQQYNAAVQQAKEFQKMLGL